VGKILTMSKVSRPENEVRISAQNKGVEISSTNPFFKDPCIILEYPDKLIFKRPTLGYMGKTRKFTLVWKKWICTKALIEPRNGVFKLDEESNEDILIVYFEDLVVE